MMVDEARLKIYGLEQDMTKLKDEKDKLQQAHSAALEAGGAVLQQMSLQAEGLRKEVTVLIAEKMQLTTQLQAKNQETYYLETELKHMTKQAVNTENALGRTAAEVEQLKKEKQQLQQLLQDTQQAAAITNHQTKQEAALAEARLSEELQEVHQARNQALAVANAAQEQAVRLQSQACQTNKKLECCLAQMQNAHQNVLAREQKAMVLESNLEEARATLRQAQQRLLQANVEVQKIAKHFADADHNRIKAQRLADNEHLLRLQAEAQLAQIKKEALSHHVAALDANLKLRESAKDKHDMAQAMNGELMSIRAEKQIMEQQMYESSKTAEDLQALVLKSALYTLHSKDTREIEREEERER